VEALRVENKFCISEQDVMRYGKLKDKVLFNFERDDEAGDGDDLCFQKISSELLGARQSKDWKDFVRCQNSKVSFGKHDDRER